MTKPNDGRIDDAIAELDEGGYMRTYGIHSKIPENPQKCIETVYGNGRWPSFSQCHFKRGQGPDGLYCHIHNPDAKKKRQKLIDKRWDAKQQAKANAPYKKIKELETIMAERDAKIEKLREALMPFAEAHNIVKQGGNPNANITLHHLRAAHDAVYGLGHI